MRRITVLIYAAAAAWIAGVAAWVFVGQFRFDAYHRRRGSAPPRLRGRDRARYSWDTMVAINRTFWWFLRARGRDGPRPPEGAPSGPPVLLVHGYLRNGSCMWGLRRALERAGRATRAVSLGRPLRPLAAYVPPLETALEKTIADSGDGRIDVVAHSMGGIILRLALARRPDLAAAIDHVVTLGSPHAGTAGARHLELTPENRQLVRGARFFDRLPDFRSSAPGARVATLSAELDYIVYPGSTSHLPGSRVVVFGHTSHVGLLTDPAVAAAVVDVLKSG